MRALPIIAFALLPALLASGATLAAQERTSSPVYLVIVHSSNPTAGVERKFLQDVFLKKTTTWPSGDLIRPVDLAPSSPIRRQFTEDVLRRSVEAVRSYWQQRIFSGRDLPPPELDSDEDVVRYVLKYDGAVGYVSSGAPLNGSKVLAVR
jgi:ABC-type phosphate transport system substrate-binding protein